MGRLTRWRRASGEQTVLELNTSSMTCRSGPLGHYDYVMNDGVSSQSFADLIRTAREARGWSQEQLELATNDGHGGHVSVSTISRWERGQAGRPEPTHVRMVCKALGIDPRRAAISLGYLTHEEVYGPQEDGIPEELRKILDILQDPAVPEAQKEEWKRYLLYLDSTSRRQAG